MCSSDLIGIARQADQRDLALSMDTLTTDAPLSDAQVQDDPRACMPPEMPLAMPVQSFYRFSTKQRRAWSMPQLAKTPYLMGDHFTVPDAYLYTTTRWGAHVGVDLSGFVHLQAFIARMRARPAVQAALHAEGLS